MILELTDIVAPSLGLPDWTLNLVILLLVIGFIIAVILSWIYDINPQGEMVKTERSQKVKEEDLLSKSNGWKIVSYISLLVIVALVVFNIVAQNNVSNNLNLLDKSIAVLPFRNDSPDEEKMYFINGTMESILNNLSMIKNLKVPGRTSVEQYRDVSKPVSIIAQELNVSYIITGSGQKLGNRILLSVQLQDGVNDQQLWSKEYDREIRSIEDLIDIQSEIARLVAEEIEVIISPEEKEMINHLPTTNLTALDFYLRGREEYLKFSYFADNIDILNKAGDFYYKALDYDSTFAQAYAGLAGVYYRRDYKGTVLSENYLDSVRILADIALSYDDQLAEAYTVRGFYYESIGDKEQAITEFDNAINLNSNDGMPYYWKGLLYTYDDLVKAIDNFQIAESLDRGLNLPEIISRISWMYEWAGFTEKAIYFSQEALKLDGDSAGYYRREANIEYNKPGDPEKSIELLEKGYAVDSSNQLEISRLLGYRYMVLGHFDKALRYSNQYLEMHEAQGKLPFQVMRQIGYIYWQNGYKQEAEYYFNENTKYCNRMIELDRGVVSAYPFLYYSLASVYAFKGEKDRAYENLRILNQREMMPSWMVIRIKNDPLFNSIRDEPEFQQIVHDVESKYQAEHERVRQWLEKNVVDRFQILFHLLSQVCPGPYLNPPLAQSQ